MGEGTRYKTDKFILKSKTVFGDLYDYSKTVFKNSKTKVEIICKKHGSFWQLPTNHIKYGCGKCGKEESGIKQRISQDEFLKRMKNIFGDNLDFSNSIYSGNNRKVFYICKKHGLFSSLPSNLFKGHGCPECGKEIFSSKNTLDLNHFLEMAFKIHGFRYDYSKSFYIKNKEKIEIICKKHGSFWQTVGNHLSGQGCPSCRNSIGEEKIRVILEENKINFRQEFTFKECKDKRKLPFDFAIFNEDMDLVSLIEFDGPQHFKQGTGYYGFHKLEIIQKRDEIKNNFCFKNKIPLLRISYFEKEKIRDKLLSFLGLKDEENRVAERVE